MKKIIFQYALLSGGLDLEYSKDTTLNIIEKINTTAVSPHGVAIYVYRLKTPLELKSMSDHSK